MTPYQISEGQRLAREWVPSKKGSLVPLESKIKENTGDKNILPPINADDAHAAWEDAHADIQIPTHCKSNLALKEEMNEIPFVLGYPQNSKSYITHVKTYTDAGRGKYVTSPPFRVHYYLWYYHSKDVTIASFPKIKVPKFSPPEKILPNERMKSEGKKIVNDTVYFQGLE